MTCKRILSIIIPTLIFAFSQLEITNGFTIAFPGPETTNSRSWFSIDNPFVASVFFKIKNNTYTWKIPSSTALRHRLTTRITTTTTTQRPSPSTIKIQTQSQQLQCDLKSCESDNLDVLEYCQDFCLEHMTSSEDSSSNSVSTTGNKKPTIIFKPESITASESDGPNDFPVASTSSHNSTHKPPGPCDPEFDCTCNYDLAPVCGTDSKTYSNLCTLECAQKCNSGIKFVHNGNC